MAISLTNDRGYSLATTADFSVLAGGPAEVEAARLEHARLRGLLGQASSRLAQLDRARPGAERADDEALIAAVSAGQPDPGPVHVAKLDADRAAMKRQADALKTAVERAAAELLAVAEEHAPDWLAQLQVEREAASERLAALVGETLAAMGEVDRIDAAASVLDAVADPEPRPAKALNGARPVSVVRVDPGAVVGTEGGSTLMHPAPLVQALGGYGEPLPVEPTEGEPAFVFAERRPSPYRRRARAAYLAIVKAGR